MVPLSDGDVACFNDEVASLTSDVDGTPKAAVNHPTSRIVIHNITEEQALQINGPIGKKGWWEVSHLEIRNNKLLVGVYRSIMARLWMCSSVCWLLELQIDLSR